MKKFTLLSLLTTPTILVFSQMSNNGYADLKLGMTVEEAKKIVNFSLKNDAAVVKIAGINLDLSFTKDNGKTILWTITSTNPSTKIIDTEQDLIGKDYATIKSILGDKMVAADFSEIEDEYFIYHNNKESEDNYDTSCVLQFDENKILKTIFASYNP